MPDNKPIILGTRGSDLALAQAHMTEAALLENGIKVEIKVIKTIGDKRPDLKLTEFAEHGVVDKGVFTKELEEALIREEIDIAVHSLKDVPTEIADVFVIPCTLPRAPIEDVILTTQKDVELACQRSEDSREPAPEDSPFPMKQGLFDEPTGLDRKTIATSSVRRARMMKHLYPGLNIEDIRGNVPTRIQKMIENDAWDGILLARAGLVRLGILDPADDANGFDFEGTQVHAKILDPAEFLPAAGQGAVGIECRKNDEKALAALATINHEPTFQRISAERAFLAALKAGCQTPVGAHTWFEGDELVMRVQVFDEENEAAPPFEGEVRGTDPEAMASDLMAMMQV